MVTSVATDTRGRATGVTYLDERGVPHQARASAVVLACSAIETARLLLVSRPGGLANGSGLVGKNLMFAAYAAGYGRFRPDATDWPPAARAMPFLDRALKDHYVAENAGLPHPKAGTILFLLPHWNPIFQAERVAAASGPSAPPLYGRALQRALREFFHETRTIEWEAFSEFLPHAGCDVTLDPDVKDRFGLPVARVRVALHQASRQVSDWLAQTGQSVLERAGAIKTGRSDDNRTYMVLQAGTARMGTDPEQSIVDANGRAHGVPGLYVADASTFPSSSGAPFTLTIMANALRIGARLAERAKTGTAP
jgi:choline dehydrogenase-like flavoprotein